MLLAAGRGVRMEPLSSIISKPALEVLGRPLLASAFDHLVAAGCTRVVVNLHRHPEAVAAAVRSVAPPGVELAYSHELDLLGSAGGIAAARRNFASGPLLVANADVWAQLDLSPLLALGPGDGVVLALLPHPDPRRWSVVELGEDALVRRIVPPGGRFAGSPYLFTGFQLLGEEVLKRLPAPPADLGPVWSELIGCGLLRGVVVQGNWQEAGTPAQYLELILTLLAGGSWRHPRAELAEAAQICSSAVGQRCAVESDAVVKDSVLTEGARLRRGASVVRCVVAGNVEIAAHFSGRDLLLLPGGSFPLQ